MADDWYYARNGERQGPVPRAKLQQLARDGWLTADDLVWTSGMPAWAPAGHVPELAGGPLGRTLKRAIDGIVPPPETAPRGGEPARRRTADTIAAAWGDLAPRHLLAAAGAFLAALGIAFTAIGGTALALAFTLGGLSLAALGMHVELGRLTAQATANLAQAWRESAARRHEARKLALENRRLELEAQRLAQERAAATRPAVVPPPVPPAPPLAAAGCTLVITHPPVQRWSPGLAALLSFLVPGLGQLYKGQIVNGVAWFFIVGLGYVALILPGLVLHLFCILGAASGNPWTEGRTEIVRE
jgi:hypothetical protein